MCVFVFWRENCHDQSSCPAVMFVIYPTRYIEICIELYIVALSFRINILFNKIIFFTQFIYRLILLCFNIFNLFNEVYNILFMLKKKQEKNKSK